MKSRPRCIDITADHCIRIFTSECVNVKQGIVPILKNKFPTIFPEFVWVIFKQDLNLNKNMGHLQTGSKPEQEYGSSTNRI